MYREQAINRDLNHLLLSYTIMNIAFVEFRIFFIWTM